MGCEDRPESILGNKTSDIKADWRGSADRKPAVHKFSGNEQSKDVQI